MAFPDISPMVLAAGHATRLRPLTRDLAKPVVPFLNRPLLDHTLDWLSRQGFARVVINLHHAAESISSRYGHEAFGMEIVYSHERELLGTGGGPRNALPHLGQRILLVNGDVVGLLSLGQLVRHHCDAGALATLATHSGQAAAGYPRVCSAADGRLLAFPGEAPPDSEAVAFEGVFTGLHLVERELLELLPAGRPAGIVDALYRHLPRGGGELHATPIAGTWYEVGDPARYIDSQLASLCRMDVPLGIKGQVRFTAGGYVSKHTHLENVRVAPPYLAGAGVRIRHGALLQSVVLGDRTRIGAGTRLIRAVAWPDCSVGPGCDLRNVVIMEGVHVPRDTAASDTVFSPEGPVAFASSTVAAG